MKSPFEIFRNIFSPKKKPEVKAEKVTPSIKRVKESNKIFIKPKGGETCPRFENQELALVRSKRRTRSKMQKQSRRINFSLA